MTGSDTAVVLRRLTVQASERSLASTESPGLGVCPDFIRISV